MEIYNTNKIGSTTKALKEKVSAVANPAYPAAFQRTGDTSRWLRGVDPQAAKRVIKKLEAFHR